MSNRIEGAVEWSVFASRWLLAPLYVGLIAGQLVFSITFFKGLWHLAHGIVAGHVVDEVTGATVVFSERLVVTSLLSLVDMIMVANLVIMVLIGGYATFVSKLNLDGEEDRPEWLDHIDPGTLKTKLAGALVSISGIHLLQAFNDLSTPGREINSPRLAWQVGIHVAFIITTLLLAWSDLIFERKLKLAHGDRSGGGQH